MASQHLKGQHIEFGYKKMCIKPENLLNREYVFIHYAAGVLRGFPVRFRQKVIRYAYSNQIYGRSMRLFFQSVFGITSAYFNSILSTYTNNKKT